MVSTGIIMSGISDLRKLHLSNNQSERRICLGIIILLLAVFWLSVGNEISADQPPNQEVIVTTNSNAESTTPEINVRDLLRSAGFFGLILLILSLTMISLILEHLLTLRRKVLIPSSLVETAGALIKKRKYREADQLCNESHSLLGEVLHSGLLEINAGYSSVIKAMEDSCSQISSKMLRKLQYLNVIGTIAPMIGLLGTVWGLMLAFLEFTNKANPQVSELAPGIYKALVTTLMGLSVAVPALASFAIFQNWIDELIAESALTSEHLFTAFKQDELHGITGAESTGEMIKEKSHGEQEPHRIPPIVREKGANE
jgi:biopolymer transport protein ExbB